MRCLLAFFFLLPLLLPAQKIKSIAYNKSRQKVIETFAMSVKEAPSTVMTLRLKAVGPSLFAYFSGYGLGVSNISAQDGAVLLLDNDSTITLKSTGQQGYWYRDKGLNSYQHRYFISRTDLEALSQYSLKGIRKSAGEDYTYISIPARYQGRAKRLSKFFLRYLPKPKTATVVPEQIVAIPEVAEPKSTAAPLMVSIRPEEAAQHIGDSITVCGKVYSARYLQRSNGKPTLLNLGAAYPNQPLTVVIYGEDREKFSAAPEEAFNNREVCVTGVLHLYNEKPQIVVRRKEQIMLKE